MTLPTDPRVDLARSKTMSEIVDRLPLEGLAPQSGELIGPCPSCGGDDRFSINKKKGVFHCRTCLASGDGIQLVMHVLACDFLGAITFLEGEADAVIDPQELERRKKRAARAKEKAEREAAQYRKWAIAKAVEVWKSADPWQGTLIEAYFAHRNINICAMGFEFRCFRFIPDHPYRKKIGGASSVFHTGPALIAGVADRKGRLGAVHQTWIDLSQPSGKAQILGPDGEELPSKLVLGSKKGGAIRLTGEIASSELVMGEGIETTLSALVIDAIPGASYWVGVDLGNMAGQMIKVPGKRHSGKPDMTDDAAFVPPQNVGRLTYIQDGDSEQKMTRAKLECGLTRAAMHVPDLKTQIVRAKGGADLNDNLRCK